jgi:U3 small nucleolar RNA-associated protein 12
LEALELADQELQNNRGKSKPSSNPMLLGMDPAKYILWVLRSIKSAELEQALLILPLGHTERLLYYLVLLLRTGHGAVELCCRVAVFTIKTHQHQVSAEPVCLFIAGEYSGRSRCDNDDTICLA